MHSQVNIKHVNISEVQSRVLVSQIKFPPVQNELRVSDHKKPGVQVSGQMEMWFLCESAAI